MPRVSSTRRSQPSSRRAAMRRRATDGQRVKPEDRVHHAEQGLVEQIGAPDVTQLVKEHVAERFA